MLRTKALNSNEGAFFQRKSKPKIEAPNLSYTKNSIFGIAMDSVKRLCDQKKLLMYLSPSSNDESASAKRTPVKASISTIAPEFTARNEEIESTSETQALNAVAYQGDENQDNRKIEFGREQEEEHYEISCSSEEPLPASTRNIDEIIGLAATNIGKEIGANCIISIEKKQ
ncbi:MAG: hypothetical protein NTV63_03110, partial [Candidatus Woesearchaeota archaeon]|nr:hypothetical protein [Candidatus Woesearchaeota archaeon]